MATKTLALDKIRTDGGTQPRTEISQNTVEEYAEEMQAGKRFPPVTVFYDGASYWLADGFHRYWGAVRINRESIEANVKNGDLRAAKLFSAGANPDHGLRRTRADKRNAVLMLLKDAEWEQWSNNTIAKHCNVSGEFVRQVRIEWDNGKKPAVAAAPASVPAEVPADEFDTDESPFGDASTSNIGSTDAPESAPEPAVEPESREVTYQRNGETRTMKVGKIGKKDAVQKAGVVGEIGADGKIVEAGDVYENGAKVGTTSEGAENSEDDLTDAEWLETLPLFSQLTGDAHNIFRADALTYRTLEQSGALGSLKSRVQAAEKTANNTSSIQGAFRYLFGRAIRVRHPREWRVCSACAGTRQYWLNRRTNKHEEPGSVESTPENELALTCTLVNCDRCKGGYDL